MTKRELKERWWWFTTGLFYCIHKPHSTAKMAFRLAILGLPEDYWDTPSDQI